MKYITSQLIIPEWLIHKTVLLWCDIDCTFSLSFRCMNGVWVHKVGEVTAWCLQLCFTRQVWHLEAQERMKICNSLLPSLCLCVMQEWWFKTENSFPGNQQNSPARKAGKLTADLLLSLHSSKSNSPVSSPAPQQNTSCTQWPTQIVPSRIPSSQSLICPSSHLQQILSGNPQATLTIVARWLTPDTSTWNCNCSKIRCHC